MKKKTAAIIVCAGSGKRMLDSCKDKLLLELSSKPVAVHSMEAFDRAASIDLLVVVTREELIPIYQQFKEEYGFQKELLVVCGGQTRMESVLNGVAAVSEDYSLIAIADGARPLIRTEDIERTIDAAKESGAAALGVYASDTTKEVRDGMILRTIPRENLVSIQTPQVFDRNEYLELAHKAIESNKEFTDDASIYEAFGRSVAFVEGHRDNWKITAPEDISLIAKTMEDRL